MLGRFSARYGRNGAETPPPPPGLTAASPPPPPPSFNGAPPPPPPPVATGMVAELEPPVYVPPPMEAPVFEVPVSADAAMTAPEPPPPEEEAPVLTRLLRQSSGDGETAQPVNSSNKFLDQRVRLHRKLIEDINLAALERLPENEIRRQIHAMVSSYVQADRIAMNAAELEEFVQDIIAEMTGLGPLEPLLKDDSIADILINGPEVVFVERRGMLEKAPTRFKDEAHLLRIINKIVSAVGRRVDESHPLCDARLLDGSRVNVAIRPIAVDGALVSIRKFSKSKLSLEKLVEVGAVRQPMADLLAAAVKCKVTLIISGGTGSGKTTMLNALSSFIPENERLITIEDAAELQLQQPHVARMETRPPNLEGKGEIRQRDLVKNALRMRPDRVILGEVRGEEAFDMLQAMNTGHEGSMATIHANNPREAISRLEQMLGMSLMPMTIASMRSQIAAAIRVIVQLQRMSDGKRRVTSIAEITGMEGEILQMQEIFKFVRVKTDPDGTIHGHYQATGVRPRFLSELQAKGITIPGSHFDPAKPL